MIWIPFLERAPAQTEALEAAASIRGAERCLLLDIIRDLEQKLC